MDDFVLGKQNLVQSNNCCDLEIMYIFFFGMASIECGLRKALIQLAIGREPKTLVSKGHLMFLHMILAKEQEKRTCWTVSWGP